MRVLLAAGADARTTASRSGGDFSVPLHLAAAAGGEAAIDALVQHDAAAAVQAYDAQP